MGGREGLATLSLRAVLPRAAAARSTPPRKGFPRLRLGA
jgi:hypothetical protein